MSIPARPARPARLALPAAAVALGLLPWSPARADGKSDARALYEQGAAAFNAGDYPRAASLLADADGLAPNPTVLRLALGASLRADDAVLGEDLALRADARSGPPDVTDLATRAHERFRARVGRVRIVCRTGASCAARLGTMRWLGGEMHAVAPGIVDVAFDEAPAHLRVAVAAGTVATLVQPPAVQDVGMPLPSPVALGSPRPPPDAVPPAGGAGQGLPPAVFWVGVALTGALGAATVVSGVDTQERRDQFLASRTLANQSAGESAVVRTNVLLGGAIVSAAATAVLGVFFTRWRTEAAVVSSLSGNVAW
jgi:hypothetical protein